MTDDILGNQTVCPSCGQLNVRLPFYFWGAPFSHLCERCLADLETGEHRLVARETGHGRWEIDCPKCKQVNVRSTTGFRTLLNPRYANLCTLCGTPLDPLMVTSGVVDEVVRKGHSALMWSAVYVMHVLVGVGISIIGGPLIALFLGKHAEMTERPLIGWSLMIVGAVAGIALAEWSRRRGTLLGNRRS